MTDKTPATEHEHIGSMPCPVAGCGSPDWKGYVPDKTLATQCLCGRREPMAGMCFDIDGNWWNGHGPTDKTPATEALYGELSESPLPGARYALDVVKRRMPAIEAQARAEALDVAIETAQARFDDLRWCNKDDNCHDLADGAELVLGDLRAILTETKR